MTFESGLCSALRARAVARTCAGKGFRQAVARQLRTVPVFPALRVPASPHESDRVFPAPRGKRRERSVLPGMSHIRQKVGPPGHGDRRFWACMRFSNPPVHISHPYLRPSGRHLPDSPDHPDSPDSKVMVKKKSAFRFKLPITNHYFIKKF